MDPKDIPDEVSAEDLIKMWTRYCRSNDFTGRHTDEAGRESLLGEVRTFFLPYIHHLTDYLQRNQVL